MSAQKETGGIGICGVLAIVFITLKLAGVVNWSWVTVLSPLWLPVAALIILWAVIALILFITKR